MSPEERDVPIFLDQPLTRRRLLGGALQAGGLIAAGGLLAACGGGEGEEAVPTEAAETTAAATTAAETSAAATTAEEPKYGGRLRVGMASGGTAETLDPHKAVLTTDTLRANSLFDLLWTSEPDLTPINYLVESFEPNAEGTIWQVRLRSGVTFHDGKPLTADDVLYTYRRILDPTNALDAVRGALEPHLDMTRTKRVDDLTLSLALKRPTADLDQRVNAHIVQDGATDFSKPIGTGPYKYVSFKPGERSLFSKNENYWLEGRPYLDELEIISFAEDSARVNALLTGEIDAIDAFPPAQARAQSENPKITIIRAPSNASTSFYMRLDQKPFDDNRVRLAFKHAIDREAIVERVHFGFARIGNDVFGEGTPYYNDQLPQREYDPEKAKALLKEAGYEDLSVTLAAEFRDISLVFSEQAKAAGIQIKVQTFSAEEYYTDYYQKAPFGTTYWFNSIENMVDLCCTGQAAYNETRWIRPEWEAKVREAQATPDRERKRQLLFEVQAELWEEGGYIFPAFEDRIDAVAANVMGVVPSRVHHLSGYDTKNLWLA